MQLALSLTEPVAGTTRSPVTRCIRDGVAWRPASPMRPEQVFTSRGGLEHLRPRTFGYRSWVPQVFRVRTLRSLDTSSRPIALVGRCWGRLGGHGDLGPMLEDLPPGVGQPRVLADVSSRPTGFGGLMGRHSQAAHAEVMRPLEFG